MTRNRALLRRLPWVVLLGGLFSAQSCDSAGETEPVAVPGQEGAIKSSASTRALRRAFDGAPPTIPHDPIGATCRSCHHETGLFVPDLGHAPPTPHADTDGISALSRCTQCHVYQQTDQVFVANSFEGFAQDLRKGTRQHESAPPVMPHPVFMREQCAACHTGPAAREEIRTTHPERENCRQCHVPKTSGDEFRRS